MLPSKLYKYENWNEHSLANLKNQQLYFSDPRRFNDPFDCSIDCVFAEISDTDYDQLHARSLNDFPYKKVFINRYGKSPNGEFKTFIKGILESEFLKSRDRFYEKNGVCCFSQTNSEILMWSHYSKSHTGFCLEFDSSFEPFNKAKPVKYKASFPEVNPTKVIVDPDSLETLKMSLTKHESCQYEKEWRSFHRERNTLYGYPAEALTGVYFGSNINPTNLEIIALIVHGQNPNVSFYQGSKSKTQYKVEFREFDYTSHIRSKKKRVA